MPSAARQRLPTDLWRQGQRRHTSVSPGLFFQSQEMQANPGNYDVFQEEKRQCNNKNKSHKRHFSGRGSPRSLPRRGSSDTLSTMVLTDSYSNCCNISSNAVLSSSDSESCLNYDPSKVCDAYAMESVAPHPSQLPFPPLEWLQSSSFRASSPTVVSGFSLKGFLGCHLAA
ncbi:unnamed protein product [Lymnaea stagnalis]|uniref:Uncharacterized protein n=1 Tax=Lymnaea stagnalis TaxID=6523 RepID=A0AAV2I324_LYMST